MFNKIHSKRFEISIFATYNPVNHNKIYLGQIWDGGSSFGIIIISKNTYKDIRKTLPTEFEETVGEADFNIWGSANITDDEYVFLKLSQVSLCISAKVIKDSSENLIMRVYGESGVIETQAGTYSCKELFCLPVSVLWDNVGILDISNSAPIIFEANEHAVRYL